MIAAIGRWITSMQFLCIGAKHAPEDINRRATVEQMLFDVAASKLPTPSREDCRQLAMYLGVRGYKKPVIAGVSRTDGETVSPPSPLPGSSSLEGGGE